MKLSSFIIIIIKPKCSIIVLLENKEELSAQYKSKAVTQHLCHKRGVDHTVTVHLQHSQTSQTCSWHLAALMQQCRKCKNSLNVL